MTTEVISIKKIGKLWKAHAVVILCELSEIVASRINIWLKGHKRLQKACEINSGISIKIKIYRVKTTRIPRYT